jgi:hypothetical protein
VRCDFADVLSVNVLLAVMDQSAVTPPIEFGDLLEATPRSCHLHPIWLKAGSYAYQPHA